MIHLAIFFILTHQEPFHSIGSVSFSISGGSLLLLGNTLQRIHHQALHFFGFVIGLIGSRISLSSTGHHFPFLVVKRVKVPDKAMNYIMLLCSDCGYYPHFVDMICILLIFRSCGYYLHFVDLSSFHGYYLYWSHYELRSSYFLFYPLRLLI